MNMLLPQAIYTSGKFNGKRCDYDLLASSSTLNYDDKETIKKYSSAGYQEKRMPPPNIIGIMYYILSEEPRKYCISVKLKNGVDSVNRDRYYCHSVVLNETEFEEINFNPFIVFIPLAEEARQFESKLNFTIEEQIEYPPFNLTVNENQLVGFNDLLWRSPLNIDTDFRIFNIMRHKYMDTNDIIVVPISNDSNYEKINLFVRLFLMALHPSERKKVTFSTFESSPYIPGYRIMYVYEDIIWKTMNPPPHYYYIIEPTSSHLDFQAVVGPERKQVNVVEHPNDFQNIGECLGKVDGLLEYIREHSISTDQKVDNYLAVQNRFLEVLLGRSNSTECDYALNLSGRSQVVSAVEKTWSELSEKHYLFARFKKEDFINLLEKNLTKYVQDENTKNKILEETKCFLKHQNKLSKEIIIFILLMLTKRGLKYELQS